MTELPVARFSVFAKWTYHERGQAYPGETREESHSRDAVYRLSIIGFLVLLWATGDGRWYWEIVEEPGPAKHHWEQSHGSAAVLADAQTEAAICVHRFILDNWEETLRVEGIDV